jgi:long-chain acyl-CoA synthetase
MTENCGTCTRVWPRDPTSSGTVGSPQPNLELKLVDVAAMGYTAEDKPFPRGEICSRGPGCFSAYYKGLGSRLPTSERRTHFDIDSKNTAAAIDDEGWLHTGDVGELDDRGRFKIVDRIKVGG